MTINYSLTSEKYVCVTQPCDLDLSTLILAQIY